jgi:O-antigen/teichoic acid export membrane protein
MVSTWIFQLLLGGSIVILFFAVSFFYRFYLPKSAFALMCPVLAFAVFAFQSQEFFRRALFSRMYSTAGFVNDIVSYGLQIIGIVILFGLDRLSVINAFYVIGIAASIASIIGYIQCRAFFTKNLSSFKDILKKNWNHGKWLLSSNLAVLVAGQSYLFITAFFLGPIGPAILKVCQSIIAPTHIVLQSLENIIPSTASRKFAKQGIPALKKFLKTISIGILGLMISYCLFASFFGERLLGILYRNQYKGYGIIVTLIGIQYVISSLNRINMIGLRVLGKTQKIFFAYVYTSIVTIILSVLLVKFFGVIGAIFAAICSTSVTFAIIRYHFTKAVEIN